MSCRMPRALLALTCAAWLFAQPASAQEQVPQPPPVPPADPADPAPAPEDPVDTGDIPSADDASPAPRRPSVRPRLFGLAGIQSFTATDSFSAVLGSSSGTMFGGGGGVIFARNVFVDVSIARFTADGSRVFIVDGGEVIDLGIPATVTVTPLDVSIGWRFEGAPRLGPTGKPRWRPVPFAGGGFGFQQYEETADFSEPGDDVSESHGSYHVLGGIELPFGRHLGAAADVLYRWVPDGLGTSGVSKYYDETDLGGAQVRFKILFTF